MKILTISWLMLAVSLGAAELRTWTSVKGTTVEATLQKYDADKGTVVLEVTKPEPKKLELKVTEVSLGDRQYLVEEEDADPKILSEGELDVPEEEVKIKTSDFEKLKEKMSLDGSTTLIFDLMRTEHFLVATNGRVRPDAVGEIAERLWFGMASHHMSFREDWGDGRMLIVLIAKERVYEEVGEWYEKLLSNSGQEQQARRVKLLWERLGSTTLNLPSAVADKHDVFTDAVVFNVKMPGKYRDVFSPFPTHSIAGKILAHQIGAHSGSKMRGYFAITTGHAYYKEIQLADKTETRLLDADDYEGDKIAEARGFEDGSSWAKTLRSLVKKGDVEPKLEALMNLEGAMHLTPEYLVLMYSFAYYMESTPGRLSAFAELIRESSSTATLPDSTEIARLFGFNSVEDLEKDWIEFIKSRDFK